MTPDEFTAALAALREGLGVRPEALARAWGYASHTSIRQMADGRQGVPKAQARWLARLVTWLARNPPPQRG